MKNKNINSLTYNISWATQANQKLGTEWDFVERCQEKYKDGGFQCTKNAIEHIGKLDSLDLIGLQEVNSDIEPKIQKVQPTLKKFKRITIGKSTISVLWNPLKLGALISSNYINLTCLKKDDRPSLVLLLKIKNTYNIVINLHAPNPLDKKQLEDDLLELLSSKKKY